MTQNTNYRGKANAVFFAAIMVVSMFAAGFAAAPAAAAPVNGQYQDDSGTEVSIVYQGQNVYLVGGDINAAGVGDSVNLREVDSFDGGTVDTSSQTEQLTVSDGADAPSSLGLGSGDRYVEIDTDDLSSGDYFLRGAGDLPNSPEQEDTFEVTTQSLSAEFDDDSVTDEGSNAETDLDISSDRGTYSINVTADGLENEELFNVLTGDGVNYADDATTELTEAQIDSTSSLTAGTDYIENGGFNVGLYQPDDEDSEQKVVLIGISDSDETVDFSGIDTDDYTFEFNVTDTEASDASSISVGELDREASFDESVYTQTAGDVVEMTVELEDTDNTWVQFGSEDSGFVDILYLEDDDDDGEVTFQVNTRTVGTNVDKSVVYNTEDDIVNSEMYDGLSSDQEPRYEDEDENEIEASDVTGADNDFEAYLDSIGQINAESGTSDQQFGQLTRPLQPTTYEVAANGNNVFIVNEDDNSELDDEIGLTTLDLTEPGVENVQTWTAPSNPADETSNTSEILNEVTQSSDVALDDQLVISAEASGIYGHMVALDSDDFDALDDGFSASTLDTLANDAAYDGEGVNFEVEADDATGNQDPTSLDLTASEDVVSIYVDQESSQMFIVVDTSEDDSAFSQSVEDGTDFTAELEYEADEDNQFNFENSRDDSGPGEAALGGANGQTDTAAFPYFAAGEDNTQSASADFSLDDRGATFDNVNDDDQVEITNSEEAMVSGTTNVAPGTEVSVRVQSTSGVSPSFVETSDDFEVNEDGTFEAELDLSAASLEDTATVAFRVAGSSIADSDAVIAEETQEPASFEVSDLSPQEATATAGDSVDVSATIENTGSEEGTQTVALTLDGDELDTTEVTLESGATQTVEFTADTTGLDAGDYEHGVATDDDEATGTLTIEGDSSGDDSSGDDSSGDDSSGDDSSGDDSSGDDSSGDDSSGDDSSGDSTDDGTPGFGALVALVALIAAALLATRRND
ncbi:BGTF surface domain-containing protein [Halorubrum sp. GN11GM_10-3_MGM]|uniref:BGTF surface domain-containing protein n=1 Tax=Halorubrum sp. GN11GM_10-3_MGM TaxID=2518111 RepID=UPI0010FA13B8|nr:BGTF surface domain-containing protein [Halorubrum sp. GN11GM_10-3_MGM]TKX72825.1 PGF-CTERM sorting domain-containing protein [Halorubrum sp. GN11GM_10-3_MGM]